MGEQMRKDKEKQAKRKEKREKNGDKSSIGMKSKKNKKKNDNAYSMNRIAQQNKNKNKKQDALRGLGGGDLFTSLDSIANKIKKDQYEKNRIVYSPANKNKY